MKFLLSILRVTKLLPSPSFWIGFLEKEIEFAIQLLLEMVRHADFKWRRWESERCKNNWAFSLNYFMNITSSFTMVFESFFYFYTSSEGWICEHTSECPARQRKRSAIPFDKMSNYILLHQTASRNSSKVAKSCMKLRDLIYFWSVFSFLSDLS